MGATKFIAERIVLNANYTSVRFGNVACSRGSVIPVLLSEMIKNKQLTITSPEVTRFIMRMSDAIKLIIKATIYAKGGEIFILKMKSFKLSDLVDVLINRIAPELAIDSSEVKVNIIGLMLGEKLHENLISEHELFYLHDLGELFMITPKAKVTSIPKHNIPLSSKDAELISKDELTEIVKEFIQNISIIHFIH